MEITDTMTVFKYGAMSSLYSCEAENKLTAYVAMVMHYDRSAHLIALYEPEEIKEDAWMTFDGKISARLDEIFGGDGAFDKYVQDHKKQVVACYKSIKKLT